MVCINDAREQDGKKPIKCSTCKRKYPDVHKTCFEFGRMFAMYGGKVSQ